MSVRKLLSSPSSFSLWFTYNLKFKLFDEIFIEFHWGTNILNRKIFIETPEKWKESDSKQTRLKGQDHQKKNYIQTGFILSEKEKSVPLCTICWTTLKWRYGYHSFHNKSSAI